VEDVSVILRYLREFAKAQLTNHLDLTGSKRMLTYADVC
jgi:hypothetical protein